MIDVGAAADSIAPFVRRTPVVAVDPGDLRTSAASVFLKLEFLQHSGSFKARGAMHFMVRNAIGPSGVVAASGGNHGVAVAWAAGVHGHRATIFVPTISSPAKVDLLRRYGATVHQVGDVYADALAASEEFIAESGATAIHAYNHADVMAGAGTTGLEFSRQTDGLDTILVACGGGGLSGGIAHAIGATTRIVVCETDRTNAYAAARAAGRPVDVDVSGLAADALGATRIGELAWDALSDVDAPGVLVSDEQLAAARDHLWDEFRIVVEPSAATTAAALLAGAYRPDPDERVGVLLCGANTDRVIRRT